MQHRQRDVSTHRQPDHVSSGEFEVGHQLKTSAWSSIEGIWPELSKAVPLESP
jgi:hypothetical protein